MQQPEYYSYIFDNSNPPRADDNNNNNNNLFGHLDLPANLSQSLSQPPVSTGESSSSSTNPQLLASSKGTTDFRRRKNWSERILVEITGLLHVLSPTGKILYCSESTHELTGFRPHELVGQSLVDFLHVDDIDVFIRDFQMAFHMCSQIKTYYRFRKKDDSYVIFEVVGQPKSDHPGQPPQSFFGIAQPVPTRSGTLLDTFLELKTENNWLKKRIEGLVAKYGPVESHHEDASHSASASKPISLDPPVYNGVSTSYSSNSSLSNPHDMSHLPSTGTNDGYPHSLHKAENWLDTSDMDDHMFPNENKHKLASNPDQDMSMDASERKDKWKRRKKTKGSDEYVCADCGTTSSPEWRKGPQGPKTLCNACGLRWAKKNKKRDLNED
ncbi:hypothetical protein BD560DRAFT_396068 [Blakeslea trispora]|nr:hypothetical protein BD560DRAFT_396068 [Blakeslea trispora]